MNRYLVVGTRHGLCNRLRVVLSAAALAESVGRKLAVVWPNVAEFPVDLSDLYVHPWVEIHFPARFAEAPAQKVLEKATRRHPLPPSRLLSGRFPLAFVATVQPVADDDAQRDQLQNLSLVDGLQRRAEQFWLTELAGRRVVGVNIRSTNAHSKTLERTPVSWFIRRMNEIAVMNSSVKFFLSADSREVADRVQRETQADVCSLSKTYEYNSRSALMDSVCDLELLGRTSYILGSYWSSFSDMAAMRQFSPAMELGPGTELTDCLERLVST